MILQGDTLTVLRTLPDASVHCVVTSPPYWGLRDYGVDGQLGLERLHDCLGWATGAPCGKCHVCRMVAVFREVRRVLRKDGTLWLNYGDSYAVKQAANGDLTGTKQGTNQGCYGQARRAQGLKPKDMVGMPYRIALALQADGWFLRSDIIWHKVNCMPESVQDRPTRAHEFIFLFSKSKSYFYDQEAVREPVSGTAHARCSKDGSGPSMDFKMQEPGKGNRNNFSFQSYMRDLPPELGRNSRTVWTMPSQPCPDAHFATFPQDLAKRCIMAGTSEKGVCPHCGAPWKRDVEKSQIIERVKLDPAKTALKGAHGIIRHDGNGHRYAAVCRTETRTTGWAPACACEDNTPIQATVLDPFLGSGTTALVALKLGRRALGIELNPEYVDMARARIHAGAGLLGVAC